MQIIKIILSVIFIIDCIALTVVVLMQEGKQQGLGAIAGAAETAITERLHSDIMEKLCLKYSNTSVFRLKRSDTTSRQA